MLGAVIVGFIGSAALFYPPVRIAWRKWNISKDQNVDLDSKTLTRLQKKNKKKREKELAKLNKGDLLSIATGAICLLLALWLQLAAPPAP